MDEKDHTYKCFPEYSHTKFMAKYCKSEAFLDLSATTTLTIFQLVWKIAIPLSYTPTEIWT